jgi:hypothetical protein
MEPSEIMKSKVAILLLVSLATWGKAAPGNELFQNRVMVGYQAWFLTPGSGAESDWETWQHWSSGRRMLSKESFTFDMWPDLSEYEQLYPTELEYPDGAPVRVYSNLDYSTVDLHFKWMKEYNISGAHLQRQIGALPKARSYRDPITRHVMKAAEKHERTFTVMLCNNIKKGDKSHLGKIPDEWRHLVDNLKVTQSPSYLRKDGLPVVPIWGCGFANRVADTPADWHRLIDWFKNNPEPRYRAYLIGGVPNKWRTQQGACDPDPAWQEVWKRFDCIQPWQVSNKDMAADKARCDEMGIDYMPVIFPGSSAEHIGRKFNNRPREGGRRFWSSATAAISAGAELLYIGMFDEIDEGTAIYKLAPTQRDIPKGLKLVTLDQEGLEVPNDWYLRLTGEFNRMVSGQIPSRKDMPLPSASNEEINTRYPLKPAAEAAAQ